jgi:hypothetical protein
MKKLLLKGWPFLVILLVVSVFFWKVFIFGQAPIPGDFIVGTYFPWLDYKWGYQVGVPVKNPITSDVVSIVYPLRSYAVDIIKTGRLPLWNPGMFGGTPLFADFQVGVLSPTMIFYFILPKIWAWTTQVMLQPFLAATFMYLLLRNFGLKKIESTFGGIFYAFAGFNMIWMEWNNSTLVAAFIPLLILLVDKFIKTGDIYWGIALSVGICLQIFAGYPQLVVYTLITVLIFVIFRWKQITKNKFILLISFLILGILLSSILLVPAVEFILNSQRKYEVLAKDLIFLPWQNLITFLAPDYFGNPATINYSGVGNYTLNAGFSGAVVLVLAIVGLVNSWRRSETKFFFTLFILSLLFSLPTPIAKLIFYSNIPLISASSMTRILILANLSLAALAAYGISGWIEKVKLKSMVLVLAPLLILLVVAVATFYFGVDKAVALRNLVLPIFFAGTAAIAIYIGKNYYKKINSFFVLSVCVLAIFELFRYGWKYTPFSSPSLVFPLTPILSFFKSDNSVYRVSPGDVIPMNMWIPYNLEAFSGYDATYPVWNARFNNIISGGDPSNADFGYYSAFYQYDSPWFDLLNNKYLLVNVKENLFNQVGKNAKFEKVFQDKSVAIFKNNKVLPRSFFISEWEVADEANLPAVLLDPDISSGKKIIVDQSTTKDGFLFISDSWFPGWKAKVDGEEAPVYRADYAFRAVPVSKGYHKVEFSYDPISLKMGLWISLGTTVILIGLVLFRRKINEKTVAK